MTEFDPSSKIATARGYTGQGVSTPNLTGRILTELISGESTDLIRLPDAQRRSPVWEREPLRWLAVRYMQNGFLRIDEAGQAGPKQAHRCFCGGIPGKALTAAVQFSLTSVRSKGLARKNRFPYLRMPCSLVALCSRKVRADIPNCFRNE